MTASSPPENAGRKLAFLPRILRRLVLVGVLAFVSLYLMATMAPKPDLGIQADGKLKPCPESPNCVSTFASDEVHQMEPIAISGPPQQIINAVSKVLQDYPRTTIVETTDVYLRAECRTLLLRFTDDVEFLVDPVRGLLHFRSSSRVGYSDLGANRKRMTEIAAAVRDALQPSTTD